MPRDVERYLIDTLNQLKALGSNKTHIERYALTDEIPREWRNFLKAKKDEPGQLDGNSPDQKRTQKGYEESYWKFIEESYKGGLQELCRI